MSTPSDKTLRLERTKLTPQAPKGRNTTLIMALVAGLAAAALAFVVINGKSQTPQQPVQQVKAPAPVMVPVAVALVDIPAQGAIDRTTVTMSSVEQSKATANAVATMSELVNMVAKVPIKKNDQIARDQIALNGWDTNGMVALVKNGYRAMTIALDPQSSIAGFLKPGNRVDVVGTFGNGQNRTVARTVLQNVYVLATGSQVVQTTAPDNSGMLGGGGATDTVSPKPADIPNATVLLSPTDSEKLIIASSQGKLMLTLRGLNDNSNQPIPTMDSTAVTGNRVAAVQVAPPPLPVFHLPTPAPIMMAPQAPTTRQITVIRGGTSSQVSVPG